MAKKFEEIKEEEYPYELPEGWKWERLGKCVNLSANKTELFLDSTKYVGLENIEKDTGIIKYEIGAELKSIKNVFVEGQILYGKLRPYLNKHGIAKFKGVCSTDILVFSANNDVSNKWVDYYFNMPSFISYAISNSTGINLPRVNSKSILSYVIPIPPKETQQKIVDIIESLFAKLDIAQEKVEQVLAESENRRSAILHNAFSGKLTEKWREENNVSFDSWSKTNFSDIIIQMQNGLSKRNGESGLLYGVLRLANINEYSINLNDLRYILLDDKEQEKYALRENDVIMIRVNGSKDNVGKQILVPQMNNIAFCDHIIRIVYNNEIVMVKFMVLLSYTKDYRNYIEEHMVSSAGQNTISRKGMNDYNINLPTILEQQEIVRLLDNFLSVEDKVKSTCQNTLEAIATMRKSILAKAFRGELSS